MPRCTSCRSSLLGIRAAPSIVVHQLAAKDRTGPPFFARLTLIQLTIAAVLARHVFSLLGLVDQLGIVFITQCHGRGIAFADLFGRRQRLRSEEHTSELQSLMRSSYAVFCLKKKKQIYIICYHDYLFLLSSS